MFIDYMITFNSFTRNENSSLVCSNLSKVSLRYQDEVFTYHLRWNLITGERVKISAWAESLAIISPLHSIKKLNLIQNIISGFILRIVSLIWIYEYALYCHLILVFLILSIILWSLISTKFSGFWYRVFSPNI